jgi:hypothetical protein
VSGRRGISQKAHVTSPKYLRTKLEQTEAGMRRGAFAPIENESSQAAGMCNRPSLSPPERHDTPGEIAQCRVSKGS